MLRQDSGTPTNQGQVRGSKRPAKVPCEGISRTSSGKRAVPWQRRRRANAGHSRQVRPVQLGLQLEGFDSCSRSRGCHVESLVCPIQGCSHPDLTLVIVDLSTVTPSFAHGFTARSTFPALGGFCQRRFVDIPFMCFHVDSRSRNFDI